MSLASIAQAVWEYPTRTTQSGSPAEPTTKLENIAKAVWEYNSRTIFSGGGVIPYKKRSVPSSFSSSSRELIWNTKSGISQRDVVFFGGGQFPNTGSRYTDSSKYGNHGTLMPNAATGPQWKWDNYLQRWGMVFNGSNEIAISLNLGIVHTLAAWVWMDDNTSDVILGNSTDSLMYWTADSDGSTGYRSNDVLETTASLGGFLTKWTHLAIVRNPYTAFTYYKNGVAVDTDTASGTAILIIDRIGAGSGLGSLRGQIADICCYNVGLSPLQIAWLANSTNHLLVPKPRIYAVATTTTPLVPPSYVYPNTNLYITKRRRSLYLRNFR